MVKRRGGRISNGLGQKSFVKRMRVCDLFWWFFHFVVVVVFSFLYFPLEGKNVQPKKNRNTPTAINELRLVFLT